MWEDSACLWRWRRVKPLTATCFWEDNKGTDYGKKREAGGGGGGHLEIAAGILPRVAMKLPPQILRLVLLTILIVAGYLGMRVALTPATFGEFGWYRGRALADLAAQPITYAGRKSCSECHSEIESLLSGKSHRGLSCEGCHGPGQGHADNPDVKIGLATTADCLRCHEQAPTRPAWHKQIRAKEHYAEFRCVECHLPHAPADSP
jgi:hypothetical protein